MKLRQLKVERQLLRRKTSQEVRAEQLEHDLALPCRGRC